MAADMGISQETLMAHYLSNHVAVAYGDVFEEMVALSLELGFKVRVLGKQAGGERRLDATMPFGG
jgi:L-fucose isomerase-like protein